MSGIPAGKYTLVIAYPKMADYLQDIEVKDDSKIDLGKIAMTSKADLLQEVVVRAGYAVRMRGDTLEYTADSFAVKPGANVEELLKRLPGIQVAKNGKITAQGEEVKKVLVEGDEFFSDDPVLATRFLQANAIDKVQVLDQKSDQTLFTGVDDGTRIKTINLKLKKDKMNGAFGKLGAGSNGQDYYKAEAMGALFNKTKKISLFGMSTKTGEDQEYKNELNKYVAEDYERIDDGTGSVTITTRSFDNDDTYRGPGVPSIQSGGAHYSDKWMDSRQKLFSNYRINHSDAQGWSKSNSVTVLPDGTGFSNTGQRTQNYYSFSQKANGSFLTPLDSFSTLKISVNGSAGNTRSSNNNLSQSINEKGFLVNNSTQLSNNTADNRTFGSNIDYRRKFRKDGRTLSVQLQQEYRNKDNNNYFNTNNNYYDPKTGIFKNKDSLDQLQRTQTPYNSYAAKAVYSDRIGRDFRILVEYGVKTTTSDNVFNTFKRANDKYEERIDSLSNNYRFAASTQITGATLSWGTKKMIVTVGGKAFFTGFRQANNDTKQETRRNFTNLAPEANVNIRIKQTESFTLRYSGQTLQPSVEQLQPLRRTSNALYVQVGNPLLKPAFSQYASANYRKYNYVKGWSLYGTISINYTTNRFAGSSHTDAQNRTIQQYINMNGVPGLNGRLRYSWTYKKIHLKPALYIAVNRNGDYSMQNDKKLKTENTSINGGVELEHEWTDKLTSKYEGEIDYSTAKSDIAANGTRHTLIHSHDITITAYLPKKLSLGSDCSFNIQPKNASFNSSINTTIWNAYLQKKLFKNDQALVRISVNDILNSNNGYRRNVYGNNTYESEQLVIKRYWMLTLAWNFSKNFK